MRIYRKLGRPAIGNNVAVKETTGEPGGHNFLKPNFMKELVQEVNGTIIECNTAYGGNCEDTESHLRAACNHGFMDIARVDIMDADGEVELPVYGDRRISHDIVGKNFLNYDFTVVLSHFKGHVAAGFGGAIKNMSIGIVSSNGKRFIHSGGRTSSQWADSLQEAFLEAMAEAAKAVADHCGDRILYISVMNNLSVDCDCDGNPADLEMGDVGILASPDHRKIHLIERIESRKGPHALVHAESNGLGSQSYELVDLD